MAPTKQTLFQREDRYHKVAELYLRGRTRKEIAAEVGVIHLLILHIFAQ